MAEVVITGNAIEQVIDLTRQGPTIRKAEIDGAVPFVVIPADCKLESLKPLIDTDRAERPLRKRANVNVIDADSFCEYFTQFRDPNSRAFADETKAEVLAILDYHEAGAGGPRWWQHRLNLKLRYSEEWKIWTGKNGQANKMTQLEFGEFLEDNAPDIATPKPASMIEIARNLTAKTEVTFASSVRVANGSVQLTYNEATQGSCGSGSMDVPEVFTICIPVYVGQERVAITVRLRYRITGGKLAFWYDLLRFKVVEREAFLATRGEIETRLGVTLINGVPAA